MEIPPPSRLWPTEPLAVCRNLLSIQELMAGPYRSCLASIRRRGFLRMAMSNAEGAPSRSHVFQNPRASVLPLTVLSGESNPRVCSFDALMLACGAARQPGREYRCQTGKGLRVRE